MNNAKSLIKWGTAGLLTLMLVLIGCSSNSAPSTDELKPENITYFKDTRTGVCYAAMDSTDYHSGWKTTTITYVPCTPEVEKLIPTKEN